MVLGQPRAGGERRREVQFILRADLVSAEADVTQKPHVVLFSCQAALRSGAAPGGIGALRFAMTHRAVKRAPPTLAA
jgi:hypothetical protein